MASDETAVSSAAASHVPPRRAHASVHDSLRSERNTVCTGSDAVSCESTKSRGQKNAPSLAGPTLTNAWKRIWPVVAAGIVMYHCCRYGFVCARRDT